MSTVPEEYKELDLYAILEIEKSASDTEIKKAYRKRALATHPDKAGDPQEFQKVAFAFSVLSNKSQRTRYDKTGSVADIDDDLSAAFAHFKDIEITAEMIKLDKEQYRQEQERKDTLFWYQQHDGDFDKVFSHVMHTEHEDEERIKQHIDDAIKSGELQLKSKYKKSTTKKMDTKRKKRASKEAKEAAKAREKLGVADGATESDLALMMLNKRKSKGSDFLDQLAAKYT